MPLSAADIERTADAARLLTSPFQHLDVEAWRSAVMRRLKELLGADSAGFLLPLPDLTVFRSEEIAPEVLAAFPDFPPPPLIDGSPLEQRMLQLRVATVAMGYGKHYHRYLDSAYNHEYATPARAHDTLAAVIGLPGNQIYGTANLHFWHERPDGRLFGDREVSIMRLLYPSLEAGVKTLTRTCSNRAALIASWDAQRDGLLVYDLQGRLLHRNPAAAALAVTRRDERALVEAGAAMAVELGKSETTAMLESSPMKATISTPFCHFGLTATRLGEGLFGNGPAVLVIVEAGDRPLPSCSALRERFGLTRRQAEVTLLLARRMSNSEIAKQLCISSYTVNSHAEAAMAKLGVRDRRKVRRVIGQIRE